MVKTAKTHGPFWECRLSELWLNGRLLKRFRQPAARQVAILAAFEALGWPPRVDDPLPPFVDGNDGGVKERLHVIIGNLNRHLPRGTIRFGGDGTGRGIRWYLDRPKRKKAGC